MRAADAKMRADDAMMRATDLKTTGYYLPQFI